MFFFFSKEKKKEEEHKKITHYRFFCRECVVTYLWQQTPILCKVSESTVIVFVPLENTKTTFKEKKKKTKINKYETGN